MRWDEGTSREEMRNATEARDSKDCCLWDLQRNAQDEKGRKGKTSRRIRQWFEIGTLQLQAMYYFCDSMGSLLAGNRPKTGKTGIAPELPSLAGDIMDNGPKSGPFQGWERN